MPESHAPEAQRPGPSMECTLTALLGGGLAVIGIQRRSLIGLLVAAVGVSMVRNALSGTCSFGFLDMDEEAERKAVRKLGIPLYSGGDETSDAVEEASMESFPASDPPALSKSRA